MKKLIGLLGVAVFAVAMFINTNAINNASDLNLENLTSMNTADAECDEWAWPMQCNSFGRCSMFGSGGGCDSW